MIVWTWLIVAALAGGFVGAMLGVFLASLCFAARLGEQR